MKPGTKLKSTACDTEVIVVRAPPAGLLTCGGVAMAAERTGDLAPLNPAYAAGSKIGKRYTDEAGTLEVLCIKPGAGSLALDGVALQVKEAKPLPSSD
jgi:hypothetical protein